MEKHITFEVELPVLNTVEDISPQKVITIPSWERGKTLLVLVGSGDQKNIIQKDFTTQKARELVMWLRGSIPGYFYDAVVKEIKRHE